MIPYGLTCIVGTGEPKRKCIAFTAERVGTGIRIRDRFADSPVGHTHGLACRPVYTCCELHVALPTLSCLHCMQAPDTFFGELHFYHQICRILLLAAVPCLRALNLSVLLAT